MKKEAKAPLTVAKGSNSAQGAKTTKATNEAVKTTFEQLIKENEELKKKLSQVPEDLESKIEYFNHKKSLIRRLAALSENHQELNRHLDNISLLSAANDFSNDRYKITVVDSENSYNNRDVFSIKNPLIIGDVITFIIQRIESKQAEIKKEIEA